MNWTCGSIRASGCDFDLTVFRRLALARDCHRGSRTRVFPSLLAGFFEGPCQRENNPHDIVMGLQAHFPIMISVLFSYGLPGVRTAVVVMRTAPRISPWPPRILTSRSC